MLYESQLEQMLKNTPEINEVFTILSKNHLSQAYLCAGAIRNLVWSNLTGKPFSLMFCDLNIFYENPSQTFENFQILETLLSKKNSKYLWNLTNISLKNRHKSYNAPQGKNIEDTIAHFPEKCSAVGINVHMNKYSIIAPYGLDDLFSMKINPTPYFDEKSNKYEYFKRRILRKNWI